MNPAKKYPWEDGFTGSMADMTLRDYFAAKAMQAIIAGNITGQEIEDRSWLEADQWAPSISYEIADAMLRARVKT